MAIIKVEPTEKRNLGQFYTTKNPFHLKPFRDWFDKNNLADHTILEPFAGANHIVNHIKEIYPDIKSKSFDNNPNNQEVENRDTLKDFPKGYKVVLTNPPWSNKVMRAFIGFSNDSLQGFENTYQLALYNCLINCDYVCALIPASFISSMYFEFEFFIKRLERYVLIHDRLFDDTEEPTCLVMFSKDETSDVKIYFDDEFKGLYRDILLKIPPRLNSDLNIKISRLMYNRPGDLLIRSVDNTVDPSILFFNKGELKSNPMTNKFQDKTRLLLNVSGNFKVTDDLIRDLNSNLNKMREETYDLFLSTFKGMRKDGKYRRYITNGLIKAIIENTILNKSESSLF